MRREELSGGSRELLRPTVFGVVVIVALVAAFLLRPPVADPTIAGLVWAGLAGAVVFGMLWPLLTARSTGVSVLAAPTDLRVGELGSLELLLSGRATGLSVSCSGRGAVVLDATAPGVLRVPLVMDRRGVWTRVQIDVGSDAPFGLAWAMRRRWVELPRPLHVAPTPIAVDVSPAEVRDGDDAVVPAAALVGTTTRSLRPYVSGDPSHLVHWPSSARLGELVVRELEPPAVKGVAIVVDLRAPAPPAGHDLPRSKRRTGHAGPSNAVDQRVASEQHAANGGAEPIDAVERAASKAAGAVASALDQGARVMLCTTEPSGPRVAEVTDMVAAGRRLAATTSQAPPDPPSDWTVQRWAARP